MPHSIFLGSALSTQNRLPEKPDKLSRVESSLTMESETTCAPHTLPKLTIPRPADLITHLKQGLINVFRIVPLDDFASEPKTHADRDNHDYTFVRAHIYHGMIDITVSLLGLAVVINALYVPM